MTRRKPHAIFLMGPTATGKTDLAAELLRHVSGEIISVDSALVYRGMDIGSAKPDAEFLARAPHHLLNIRDPAETYSAADFVRDATPLMARIAAEGKVPILVGGTMLYFRALLEGLSELPPSDPEVREAIGAEAAQVGWPEMHRRLAVIDPQSAAELHPNHSQRIQRALEIFHISGVAASELKSRPSVLLKGVSDEYDIVQLALVPKNRALLHHRIATRFLRMLELGFEDEVQSLRKRGDLTGSHPAMRAVGYRQMWEYLDGTLTREEMIEKAIAASRQLAKRQLTWLRDWPDLHRIVVDDGVSFLAVASLLAEVLKILKCRPIY